jgi:hypothetical protein
LNLSKLQKDFCSKWAEEQSNIDKEFKDVWDEVHPNVFQPTIGPSTLFYCA